MSMMAYDAIKRNLFIGLKKDLSWSKSIFRRPRCLHALMGRTRLIKAQLTVGIRTQTLIGTEGTMFVFLYTK